LALEQSPSSLTKSIFQEASFGKVNVVDAVSDSRGWNNKENSTRDLTALRDKVKSCVPIKSTSVLFVDSIISLLHHGHSETQIAVLLSELKPSFSSIVCVAHVDVSSSLSFVLALESVSTCVIELVSSPKLPLINVTGSFSILQKRKSGKVSRVIEHYSIEQKTGKLSFYTDAQVSRKEAPAQSENNKIKLQMDVLSPEQEAARAAVVLPFSKAKDLASTSVSGLPEHSLDVEHPGSVYVDPEDIDPDDFDDGLDDF
jgi:hypothetical protein